MLGSTGLTGAVDTIIGFRRKRGTSDAEISVAGRDVDECEKPSPATIPPACGACCPAIAADHRRAASAKAILDLLKDGKIRTIKEISENLGQPYDAVRMMLARMHEDGDLRRIGKGYCL